MIEIDRQAGSSVQEQIARQLRYLIASEHFAVGDTLPGTRRLAEEADVSFHTVRKAYQQLQQEGLLETSPGKGYVVQERSALDQEARLERGADVMRGALREMIGMGLRPSEISRLARKQLRRVGATRELELLFVAPHQNQARACAEQVSAHLERPVEPALPADLAEHEDADYVFAPHALVQQVAGQLPRCGTVGVVLYPNPSVLNYVARLHPDDTVGLVAHPDDDAAPLVVDVRSQTGFQGRVLPAPPIDDEESLPGSFLDEIDVLVFTPRIKRRVEGLPHDDLPRAELRTVVSAGSLDAISAAVPSR
jgi:GntR family transcriptional regulator